MTYDLIIIGAGAAGLFAAANAPVHFKTLVLEKTDSPGKKLCLTGNGQCNLTNTADIKMFLNRYGKNGRHLRPVLFPFSNIALMEYFKKNDLLLKIREDGKVFPASMKSTDILNLFIDRIRKQNITIRYKTPVIDIIRNNTEIGGYTVITPEECLLAKNILVVTGGATYPETGSDGSFFTCLERLGLEIVPLRPALTPIYVRDYPYRNLSGLTVQNCIITLTGISKSDEVVKGSILLTHKGFSGPTILTLSRYVTIGNTLKINWQPGKTCDGLRKELIEKATAYPGQITTLLDTITGLPQSLIKQICMNIDIEPAIKASTLSGREMGELANHLTNDSHEISTTGGYNAAMATAGGISLKEINLSTMEANRYPGLFFAGEVLDVDGDTDGYNLQFAFSSAMQALRAMAK